MPNSNLVQLIKKIALEAINASKPCDYSIGVIIKTEPLTVKISNNITIDEDFLHLTQTVSQTPLQNGDKILMIRKSGGNEYTVIDKVVS